MFRYLKNLYLKFKKAYRKKNHIEINLLKIFKNLML